MRLVPTDEQEELRESVRRFLADRSPMSAVRRVMDTPEGFDRRVWQGMAEELGLQGVAVPERFGGAGLGQTELGVVLEEMGSALLPAPFLASSAVAAGTLLALDDEAAKDEWLPGIASGRSIVTAAIGGEDGGWDGIGFGVVATARDDGWVLDGSCRFVLDGCAADAIIVVADAGREPGFFLLPANAAGLRRAPLRTMDPTRRLARLDLDRTPARRLAAGDPRAALGHVRDLAALALAAEQVGGLRRCLEMSVEYAKVRVQFGRPIGSFQAIKHRCADMHVAMELAVSAVRYAAWAADECGDELPVAASVAKAYCSDAFSRVAAETIQVHGGIGFTWEHDAHLLYRRARSSERLFGDPDQHHALLADRLGV